MGRAAEKSASKKGGQRAATSTKFRSIPSLQIWVKERDDVAIRIERIVCDWLRTRLPSEYSILVTEIGLDLGAVSRYVIRPLVQTGQGRDREGGSV